MAGDREAQGAALIRTDKQNAGELISQVAQLRATQEAGNELARETNALLRELVGVRRPWPGASAGPGPEPAPFGRHGG